MNLTARLRVGALEQRIVPVVEPPVPVGIWMDRLGIVNIVGDYRHQEAAVSFVAGDIHVSLTHKSALADPSTTTKDYPFADVRGLVFRGKGEADSFVNATSKPVIAFGGAGNDVLIGGFGIDYLAGESGDDLLEGRGGDDNLLGGFGSDTYRFDRTVLGTDVINEPVDSAAPKDRDRLDFSRMTTGVVVNLASTATQTVALNVLSIKLGNAGAIEEIYATPHADRVLGNKRPNLFRLDGGNDFARGESGHDTLWGGTGNDTLIGGAGNDRLYGEYGDDHFVGETGNDYINSGLGNNTSIDGVGNDYTNFASNSVGIMYESSVGNDTVIGSQLADSIKGPPMGAYDPINYFVGNLYVDGGAGDDTLWGYIRRDTLIGGVGNDQLVGSYGDDELRGGGDDDSMWGGFGADIMDGDWGNDQLYGGDGNDLINGGNITSGNDTLDGGPGRDTMDGGTGFDTLLHADYDLLYADRGDETLRNGESVVITIPDAFASTNHARNAAFLLLRSHEPDAFPFDLTPVFDALETKPFTRFGLNATPRTLANALKLRRPSTKLEADMDLNDLIDVLKQGRPVIALLGNGSADVSSPIPGEIDQAPVTMNYVCVMGFDLASQSLFFVDYTSGTVKQMSFAAFSYFWDWTGTGATYDLLASLGIKKRTMIW